MADAQGEGRMVSEKQVVEAIEAFSVAVELHSRTVRRVLQDYGGYECKETDPGKFTLAFRYNKADG